MAVSIVEGYRPGCAGRIAQLHAEYHEAHFGRGLPFESKAAQELTAFRLRLDAERDGLWLPCDPAVRAPAVQEQRLVRQRA